MGNISKDKRNRMLDFLNRLKEEHNDDDVLKAIYEIENELACKKYGLLWEKHKESVDEKLETHIPVFTEDKGKEIKNDKDNPKYNFLLEGDNLHSLKLLEKTHKGKVDGIYIDPPYNRGKNDFIYDDKYIDENDGFKHSKWLSFMSERLILARRLLSKEGVIFISIDDNEQAPLKLLCDEIFDQSNFLGMIIQNKLNAKNDTLNIQRNHEYILAYRKQCNYLINGKVKPSLIKYRSKKRQVFLENGEYYYINDSITTRGEGGVLSKRQNLGYTVYYNPNTNHKIAICDYDKDLALTSDDEELVYTTCEDMVTKGYIPIRPPRVRGHLGCWTWELEKFKRDSRMIIIKEVRNSGKYNVKKRTFVPREDVYEENGKYYYNTYSEGNSKSIIEFSTNDGSSELSNILGQGGMFNNPKNLDMIKYLLRLIPNRQALILDFFAGSGTTAQAVLELNNEDRGKRSFIMCTNNQNNICDDVTYKRIRNRITGYNFVGKKENVLLQYPLSIEIIKNNSKLLEEVETVIEEMHAKFSTIEQCIRSNMLVVVGIEESKESIEGIPSNVKYYKTDFVEKKINEGNQSISDNILNHIREMVQLENAINIDNKKHHIILTDDDADKIEMEWSNLKECKTLYISKNVLLTASQRKLFSTVETRIIPDYYFENELKEVGEIW